MAFYPKGSLSGNYIPSPDLSGGKVIVGHEFSWRKEGDGQINTASARFILEHLDRELPMVLNTYIASAMKKLAPRVEPALVVGGEPSSFYSDNGRGTTGELEIAKDYMLENKILEADGSLAESIHVSQAFHIGRIGLQANLIGLKPLLPAGLTKEFDKQSAQPWIRNRAGWMFREALAVPVLKHQGKL